MSDALEKSIKALDDYHTPTKGMLVQSPVSGDWRRVKAEIDRVREERDNWRRSYDDMAALGQENDRLREELDRLREENKKLMGYFLFEYRDKCPARSGVDGGEDE